jgi:hypothetical protein
MLRKERYSEKDGARKSSKKDSQETCNKKHAAGNIVHETWSTKHAVVKK